MTVAETAASVSAKQPERPVYLQPQGFPGRIVPWGQPWQVGTAAYWIESTRLAEGDGRLLPGPHRHRLAQDLRAETAICILGGFGMPFETGLRAYQVLTDHGALRPGTTAPVIEAVLRAPMTYPDGSVRRYRFPAQRALRLAAALARFDRDRPPSLPHPARDWLLTLPGVGAKTASWIVRNHFGCDDVAILDIHVMRAGVTAKVFDPAWKITRDYAVTEAAFVAWARHGNVPTSDLDAVIWAEMAGGVSSRRAGYRRQTRHDRGQQLAL